MAKVFVYGTLKSDGSNNVLLQNLKAWHVGVDAIVKGFTLHSVLAPNYFPAAVPKEGAQVRGEVWELDDPSMLVLDTFEKVQYKFYERKLVMIDYKFPDGVEHKESGYIYVAGPQMYQYDMLKEEVGEVWTNTQTGRASNVRSDGFCAT